LKNNREKPYHPQGLYSTVAVLSVLCICIPHDSRCIFTTHDIQAQYPHLHPI